MGKLGQLVGTLGTIALLSTSAIGQNNKLDSSTKETGLNLKMLYEETGHHDETGHYIPPTAEEKIKELDKLINGYQGWLAPKNLPENHPFKGYKFLDDTGESRGIKRWYLLNPDKKKILSIDIWTNSGSEMVTISINLDDQTKFFKDCGDKSCAVQAFKERMENIMIDPKSLGEEFNKLD